MNNVLWKVREWECIKNLDELAPVLRDGLENKKRVARKKERDREC